MIFKSTLFFLSEGLKPTTTLNNPIRPFFETPPLYGPKYMCKAPTSYHGLQCSFDIFAPEDFSIPDLVTVEFRWGTETFFRTEAVEMVLASVGVRGFTPCPHKTGLKLRKSIVSAKFGVSYFQKNPNKGLFVLDNLVETFKSGGLSLFPL